MSVSSTPSASPNSERPARQHYARAPILETVLEVLVEYDPGLTLATLKSLGKREPDYSETQEIQVVDAEMSVDPKGKTTGRSHRRHVGYQFIDRNRGQILAAQKGRFAFSKLEPYTEWESVRAEAERLWDRYSAAGQIRRITRIGVRYVNRLDLPIELPDHRVELKDWLRIGPEIPDVTRQRLGSFAIQLSLLQVDLPGTIATIREAVVAPSAPDVVSIILDIDVHQSGEIPPDNLWPGLDVLHDRENLIFESSITDRLRELIR